MSTFFGLVVAVMVLCLAIGIPGWQVFNWLQTGEWEPWSGLDAIAYVTSWFDGDRSAEKIMAWIQYPQSWFGLHTFMDWVHGVIFPIWPIAWLLAVVIQDSE